MNPKSQGRLTPVMLSAICVFLLFACGLPGRQEISRPLSPRPSDTISSIAPTSTQAVSSPSPTSISSKEETPYPLYDVGQGETWDGRSTAYLLADLATPDQTASAFEQQLRWGFGLLYERYPGVEVLEAQLLWQDEYTFLLDADVRTWEGLVAGRTSWAEFWKGLEKSAVGMETGDLYDGEQVDALLEELSTATAGPVASPKKPLPPTSTPVQPDAPTRIPTPTRSSALPFATPVVPLDATYEDPDGFFALDYPAEWTLHRSGSEMQFWADEEGNAALAVSIHVKALSAQALVDDVSALLSGKWDDYRELTRAETTLSGYPAVGVEQTYRWDGVPHQGLMLGTVRNRVGYLILAWSPEKEYSNLEPTFEAIANSLRLTEFAEAPLYDKWLTHESSHFIFHYLPDTYVAREIKSIASDHEWAFGEIVRSLGVSYSDPIHFYLYPSEEALYRATARNSGFAINEGHEVHALWISAQNHQSLGHEMTHVITSWALGEPSEALLGEGIAVCMDHSGKDHHATAADLLRAGELTPPSQLLGNAWFEYKWAYPVSGSFVCFLLDGYGVERFKALYPRTDFETALQQTYGADLTTLEEEWLDTLRKRRPHQ